MSNHSKGGAAEREAAEILTKALGVPVRRKLGAGRMDDTGDLEGLEGLTVQCAWWPSGVMRAIHEKPGEVEVQAINAGTRHAVSMIRLVGGRWRMVLTVEQFARLYQDAMRKEPV